MPFWLFWLFLFRKMSDQHSHWTFLEGNLFYTFILSSKGQNSLVQDSQCISMFLWRLLRILIWCLENLYLCCQTFESVKPFLVWIFWFWWKYSLLVSVELLQRQFVLPGFSSLVATSYLHLEHCDKGSSYC